VDEPEGGRVATGLLEFVEDPHDLLPELLRRRVREDTVREASRAAEGWLGATADEDPDAV
jgi:hypothetical protein